MKKAIILFLTALVWPGAAVAEDGAEAARLFRIERNKNANIVVYDAMVLPDGNLRPKDEEAVEVYWLKLAEGGERKGLKGIERRMAYGFKIKERQGNRLTLEMVADIGRPIEVAPVDAVYKAFVGIDGRRSALEKVFIFAKETAMLPSVQYIELYGTDTETGEETYEKFLP